MKNFYAMKWKDVNNKLILDLEFKNQTDLAHFLLKVAKLSDKIDHHSDMYIYDCFKLRLVLFSHAKQGISDLDHELSELILKLII